MRRLAIGSRRSKSRPRWPAGRMCSRRTTSPPSRRTRRASLRPRTGSGNVQKTKLVTTASKTPSLKTTSSAPPPAAPEATPPLPQAPHRIRQRAEDKARDDGVEDSVPEGQVLRVRHHEAHPSRTITRFLGCALQHPRAQIGRHDEGPLGVVRQVLPGARPHLEDAPL